MGTSNERVHHLEVLARAGAIFPASLDLRETAEAIADFLVSEVADYGAIDLTGEGGELERVVTRGGPLPPELSRSMPAGALHRVLESGRPERVDQPPRLLLLPLSARGRTPGTITLARVQWARGYSPEELSLVEELAGRAAVALDNARRHRETSDATHYRDQFLLLASHELATPMTPLRLNAEILAREARGMSRPGRNPDYFESVAAATLRGVDRVAGLASRLLDVAQIITGKLELDLEEVDLAEVAGEVTAKMRPSFEHADCELSVALEPAAGRWDRRRLVQLVEQLLANTLKYAAGAPVHVAVSKADREAVLEVADRGIGVPQELQARIFERFERLGQPASYGGLGLGLWVVRQVARALGGEIELESEPGTGAKFTVRLPLV